MTMKRVIKKVIKHQPKAVDQLYVVYDEEMNQFLQEYPLSLRECEEMIQTRLDDCEDLTDECLKIYAVTNFKVEFNKTATIIDNNIGL